MNLLLRVSEKLLLIVALSVLCGGLSAQTVNMQTLPYPEDIFPELGRLLQAAEAQSPALLSAEHRVDMRRGENLANESIGKSRLWTYSRLGARAEWRSGDDDSNNDGFDDRDNPDYQGEAQISVNWNKPVWRWGNLDRQERISQWRLEAAELEAQSQIRDRMALIRQTYLRWLFARERLRLTEENIALAETSLRAREQLAERGTIARLDILEARVSAQERQEEWAWLERELLVLRQTLQQLTGVDDVEPYLPDGPLEATQIVATDPQVMAALEAAAQRSTIASLPEVGHLEALAEAERLQYEVFDRQWYPTVDLVSSVYTDRLDDVNTDESEYRLIGFFGVQLNWEIFDGWRRKGQQMYSFARRRVLELETEEMVERLDSESERLLADLQYFWQQIHARQSRVDISRQRLAAAEGEYQRGTRTSADLLRAQLDWERARQDLLDASFYFLINLTDFRTRYLADDPPRS